MTTAVKKIPAPAKPALAPTPSLTFDDDKFQRKPFAERLTRLISVDYEFAEGAYVISLHAPFGSGKTTFLKMWQHHLETQGYKTLYINAWETDFADDPLVPIISALLEYLEPEKTQEKLKSSLQGALGAAALGINQILAHKVGLDVQKIMEGVEGDLTPKGLKDLGGELHAAFQGRKEAYDKLRKLLAEYIAKLEHKPFVIIVDELDRARPTYSVEFLEAIKHIFSVPGLCFVLGVDQEQLSSSLKVLYGQNLDFHNYYRRFVTMELPLPTLEKIDLIPFIRAHYAHLFEGKITKGQPFIFKPEQAKSVVDNIATACAMFQLTPRQIQVVIRILSVYFVSDRADQIGRHQWMYAAAFLVCMSLHRREYYHKLGTGQLPISDFVAYIESLKHPEGHRSNLDWTIQLLLALALNEKNQEQCLNSFKKVKGVHEGSEDMEKVGRELITMLTRTISDHGGVEQRSAFGYIYTQLETWRRYFEEPFR